jgi:hypothetical protein
MQNINQHLVYIYTLVKLAKEENVNKIGHFISDYMLALDIADVLNDRGFRALLTVDKTSTDFLLVISWE